MPVVEHLLKFIFLPRVEHDTRKNKSTAIFAMAKLKERKIICILIKYLFTCVTEYVSAHRPTESFVGTI